MKYLRISVLLLLTVVVSSIFILPQPGLSESAETGSHEEHAHEHGAGESTTDPNESPYEIHFKTHPKPEKIVPDQDMVELMFEVTHKGEPARDVDLSYRVQAPPKNFWFRTDFPVVEGSQLLSGTVYAPNGSQVISMILPIRGNYTVKATARGPEGVTHATDQLSVSENPQEVMNLSIFLVVLFLFGLIGGYFMSDHRTKQNIGSWIVLIAGISVGTLFLKPTVVHAHGEGSWDPHNLEKQKGVSRVNDNYEFSVKTFPQPVEVGEMLTVQYSIKSNKNNVHQAHHSSDDHGHAHDKKTNEQHASSKHFLAESHFVHSEGGLEMVTQSSQFEDGKGTINVQLFDGAPHYLVTRFYRPTESYKPTARHDHGHGSGEQSRKQTEEHGHEERKPEGDDGHDHEEHDEQGSPTKKPPWEAKMEYHLEAGKHTVTFQESGDPAMKWLLLKEDANPEESPRDRFKTCESVEPGTTIPGELRCYDLQLRKDGTKFTFTVPEDGHYNLYTQHLPREFNMSVQHEGKSVNPDRKFITGKGEYLGQSVKFVDVSAVQPPLDSIVKSLLTLLMVVGLGFLVGFKAPKWL